MFELYAQKAESIQKATTVLADIRSIYTDAKRMQEKLALYNAATDLTFNAMIDALFSVAERTELGNMLAEVNALVLDWEANHRAALG